MADNSTPQRQTRTSDEREPVPGPDTGVPKPGSSQLTALLWRLIRIDPSRVEFVTPKGSTQTEPPYGSREIDYWTVVDGRRKRRHRNVFAALRDPEARSRLAAVLRGVAASSPRSLALPLALMWALFVSGLALVWPWVDGGISEAAFSISAVAFLGTTLCPLIVALIRTRRLLGEEFIRDGLSHDEGDLLTFIVLPALILSYIPLLFAAMPVSALILNLLGLEVR